MRAAVTLEKCGECKAPLVAWPYIAADGDMMFNPNTGVTLVIIEGHDPPVKRAALLCPKCDLIERFPRRNKP